tara:strand:- start:754 stop:966 length:213 start_codon:yes stop_codon:yes gene_type:complete
MTNSSIEEFITYKGFIYKKVGEIGSMIKHCPNCKSDFFTKEQRQIYCSTDCKNRYYKTDDYRLLNGETDD